MHPEPTRSDLSAPRPHVAVVGGGVTGLVVARDLARAGLRVTLYEAETRLGGRVRATDVAGLRCEVGAEAFATRGGAVAELVTELGLADQIVAPAALGSWLVSAADGTAVPLPPAGAMGVPAAPLGRAARRALGIPGAVRAAIDPLLPRRIGAGSVTLADLVRARMGARVLDRLVRPVTLGVSSTDPERIPLASLAELAAARAETRSLTAAARRLRESAAAAGGAVLGLRGGMSALVDALAAECHDLGVTIKLGTQVTGVTPLPSGGLALRGGVSEVHADAVVLALPEGPIRQLLSDASAAPAQSTPVEVIALVLDAAHPAVAQLAAAPRGTGALVSAPASPAPASSAPASSAPASSSPADPDIVAAPRAIVAKALTHVSQKWPGIVGEHREVLRLSYGRAGDPPATAALGDEAALELALQDASRILGTPVPGSAVLGFARQPWQMPVRSTRPPQEAPSGVHLIGDWSTGAGFAALIPAARQLAQRLATSLSEFTTPHTLTEQA